MHDLVAKRREVDSPDVGVLGIGIGFDLCIFPEAGVSLGRGVRRRAPPRGKETEPCEHS